MGRDGVYVDMFVLYEEKFGEKCSWGTAGRPGDGVGDSLTWGG